MLHQWNTVIHFSSRNVNNRVELWSTHIHVSVNKMFIKIISLYLDNYLKQKWYCCLDDIRSLVEHSCHIHSSHFISYHSIWMNIVQFMICEPCLVRPSLSWITTMFFIWVLWQQLVNQPCWHWWMVKTTGGWISAALETQVVALHKARQAVKKRAPVCSMGAE